MAAKQDGAAPAAGDPPSPAQASDTLASKFPPKFLEGVDFIETEEDAKAVEAATLKIQSTFRGKKFRLKGQAAAKPATGAEQPAPGAAQKSSPSEKLEPAARTAERAGHAHEQLSARLAEMQVNDNEQRKSSATAPEDEVERAATKIQAGFKGYKTRKELEGSKLASGGAGAACTSETSAE